MAAHSFGGSGMDERGRGETGSGRWPTFILKENNSVVQPREGGWGGRCGRACMEAGEEGERGDPGTAVGDSRAAVGGGSSRVRRGRVAKQGRRRGAGDAARVRLTSGTGWQWGPVVSGGVREKERRARKRGGGALTCGPG
jgi:hypothetical protein